MADERGHYAAGVGSAKVIPFGEWRILPGRLLRPAVSGVAAATANDYDLLLVVANWPAAREARVGHAAPARAMENLACAAGVNIVGTDGNHIAYTGGTVAYGADGAGAAGIRRRSGCSIA